MGIGELRGRLSRAAATNSSLLSFFTRFSIHRFPSKGRPRGVGFLAHFEASWKKNMEKKEGGFPFGHVCRARLDLAT